MARLKGGKVFIDLSHQDIYVDDTPIQKDLTEEETDAILSKGLIIKLNIAGRIFTHICNFNNLNFDDESPQDTPNLSETIYINREEFFNIAFYYKDNNIYINQI